MVRTVRTDFVVRKEKRNSVCPKDLKLKSSANTAVCMAYNTGLEVKTKLTDDVCPDNSIGGDTNSCRSVYY